jgi:long-chain fatty acid transport protein
MTNKKWVIFLILPVILTLGSTAWASGLSSYEQGQPSIGTANVGQAVEDDASIAYFNPAGMTRLERSEVLMGNQLLVIKSEFESDDDIQNPFTGNAGGNAGMVLPGGGFYYVQKLFKGRTALGFAANAPAGAGLNYDNGWKGRYLIQESFALVANLNPAIALKLTDWLHVGAGVSIYYMFFHQEMAIFNPPSLSLRPLEINRTPDGKAKMNLDDWDFGYNLGILLEPRKGSRVGIAYRSQADFDLEGKIEFDHLQGILAERLYRRTDVKLNIPLARSIMVSAYQEVTPKWALLFDVGWQNWSALRDLVIKTGQGAVVPITMDWHDTWRIGLGTHYRILPRLLLKAGFSYDSDPSSLANRLPLLPVDQQWRWAAGFDFDLNKSRTMTLSLNWEFVDLGSARIDKGLPAIAVDPTPGPLIDTITIFPGREFRGHYDQFMNVIALSFRWKFGKPEKVAESKAEQPSPAGLAKVG